MLKRKQTLKEYINDYQSSKYSSRVVKGAKINSYCPEDQEKKIEEKMQFIKNTLLQKMDPQCCKTIFEELDDVINILKPKINQNLKYSSINKTESPGFSCKLSGISNKKIGKTKNYNIEDGSQKKENIFIIDCNQQLLKPERNFENFNSQKKSQNMKLFLQDKDINDTKYLSSIKGIKQKPKSAKKGVSFQPPELQRKDSSDYDFLDIQSIRNTHISSIFSNTYS